MSDDGLVGMLDGASLTTARIFYRRPDYLNVLQEFVWQQYDWHPRFPRLKNFLGWWERELEGPLHSVVVAHSQLIKPAEIKLVGSVFRIH